MGETSEQEDTLFIKSLKNHMKLVNILFDARNENGISEISQPEMAKLMNRSQTWVVEAIKRLNTEDRCIEMVSPGKYIVHYTNIYIQGVFFEILKLMADYIETKELFFMKDKTIAEEKGIKVKTVQMFKSYLRVGWRKNSSED